MHTYEGYDTTNEGYLKDVDINVTNFIIAGIKAQILKVQTPAGYSCQTLL